MESPNLCLMCLYMMLPSAYSDSRKEKGVLITNNNKIPSMKTLNQMNNELPLLEWLNIFKQMPVASLVNKDSLRFLGIEFKLLL